MWAQYMADRFPDNVFRNILANDNTGIESVEEYLKSPSLKSQLFLRFQGLVYRRFQRDRTPA